ncbi:Cytochrome p450 81d1, putative [Theobroma cacao]|uniref:Cytochrome p450 81d1, putative n=1 Tax=Theobroma cacao TaxID=3641 RepID=A0A061DGP5_THECC|nr:Cytochrome p450 81d1, putative [Theobroma cacao]
MLAGVLMDEIKILLRKLHSISAHKFTKVELGPLISGLTFNIVTRMIAGKRYYGEDVVGIEEARQFRELVGEMFADGRATYPGDFLPIFKYFDRQGGTHTVAATIEWAMSNLLNHPGVLKKARAEVDDFLCPKQLQDETDLSKLQYLQNIVSETFRLYPATPLLVPHISSDNCTIGVDGYKLLTFGLGRRACPGMGLANRIIGLTLGSLIQCFEWERVDGKAIDMVEGSADIAMPKLGPWKPNAKLVQ